VIAWIISLPMITGMSPKQFQKVTTCFLEKKANVKRINKMRTIWLLDAFYSLTQRIMARQTYKQAGKAGLLAIEDFGGRKGKDASMQAINIRIMMDVVIQQRKNTVIRGIDYTNCFDRMAHALTSLKLRQLGHTKEAVLCRYSTVQKLEVTIRTAFGDAKIQDEFVAYIVPLDNPFQGSLQGGADSMINWGVVGSEIIHMMREMGHGMAFKVTVTDKTIRFSLRGRCNTNRPTLIQPSGTTHAGSTARTG